ncbi:MAG: hypothetical protein HOE90_02465 [Bacteriovoracaceae bacterium]|jgi:hypothetical protein|nr:hypothetical protein [Bacteriovoracaceae bacterium]
MKKLMTVLFFVGLFSVASEASANRCQSQLKNGRGRVIRTFSERGRDRRSACQRASQACTRELRWMRRSGRHPYAYCTTNGRPGPGRGNTTVRRSCVADLVSWRGRFVRSFNASERGRRGSGVKARACAKARLKCERKKFELRRPAAQCLIRY